MRARPLLLLAAVHLLAGLGSGAAWAQTSSAGTCSGSMTGSVGIGVYRSGNIVSVNAASLGNVFGQAECLCDDPATDQNDLQLEILLTQLLPADANGSSLELWVGNGCDSYTTRTNPNLTTCQKIATTLQAQSFITGVASTNVIIRTPISASSLSAPTINSCTGATQSRSIYLFIFKDPTSPLATCTLNTNINNTGPAAPGSPSVDSGDEAVTVKWKPPAATDLQPLYYQLLCASADGQPVPNKKSSEQAYSTCLAGGDFRQRNTLSVGGNSIAAGDMGSTAAVDMNPGTATFHPEAAGDDLGLQPPPDPDMADPGSAVPDMADGDLLPPATGFRGVTSTSLPSPFTSLDPAYICSKAIPVGTTTIDKGFSERIGGLVNGTSYVFAVLAVDSYGNVTPSSVLTATPEPVEDFYRRYASDGGTASGFCVASGELGPSGIASLVLLVVGLAIYNRRRIKQWWERA